MKGYKVAASRLNIRLKPEGKAEILDIAVRDQILLAPSHIAGYAPILMEDDSIGWAVEKYLEAIEAEPDYGPELPETKPLPESTEDDPPWMAVARGQMGTAEVAGASANQQILAYFMATSFRPTRGDEDPWCSGFACWCMEQSGRRSTRDARAISWRDWGTSLDKPRRGCVVVFPHHVGFFDKWRDDGRLDLLGGNQGSAVNIAPFNPADALAYRWPEA